MLRALKSNNIVMFVISFIISFLAVWLVFSHFRHTLMNKITGQNQSSNSIAYAETPLDSVPAPDQTTTQDSGGCGCPACCSVAEVL